MRGLSKVLLVLTGLIAVPSFSDAKTMLEIFGHGVFDTSWGMSIDEVKAIHPSGKTQEVFGTTRYFITDGRSLFGIEREKNSFIGFVFGTDEKLIGVSIGMPSGTGSFAKTQTSITTSIGVESKAVDNSAGVPIISWSDETGIEIKLMKTSGIFSQDVTLTIEKKPTPKDTTKEALGF
ncbi:hypothetical protein ACFL19_01850 [Pseudomonadota bacterium]